MVNGLDRLTRVLIRPWMAESDLKAVDTSGGGWSVGAGCRLSEPSEGSGRTRRGDEATQRGNGPEWASKRLMDVV